MLQKLSILGCDITLYAVFDTLAGLTLLLYLLLQTSQYRNLLSYKTKSRKKKTVLAIVQLIIIGVSFYLLLSVLNRAYANWFTRGNANYYGNLTAWPIIMLILPICFRVSSFSTMDLLTPGLPLCLFVAKIACFFYGCCSGFEMSSSFYYNQNTGRYEFPVQMVEALVALALFFFISYYRKKSKIPGSVFPVYLMIYSASRFITEFFRADLPKIIGPFDSYQVMSVTFLILGCIFFYFVWIYNCEKQRTNNKA